MPNSSSTEKSQLIEAPRQSWSRNASTVTGVLSRRLCVRLVTKIVHGMAAHGASAKPKD